MNKYTIHSGRKLAVWTVLLLMGLIIISCRKDPEMTQDPDHRDLTHIPYQPTSVTLDIPSNFPPMDIPEDNALTEEGIRLGRHLFYDPILSLDSTISCSSCHQQELSFTDGRAVSEGIDGLTGTRSSMSLENVGYVSVGLFWDGRAETLEEQALEPVENPVEMHEDWPNVEEKFRRHGEYPGMFREAFGIQHTGEITKELAVKAIAQFMRTMISGESKFDRVQNNQAFFTDQELMGYDLFFDLPNNLPDAECGHCHNVPFFSVSGYFNNGIDSVETLDDFPDLGRGAVTGKRLDNGRFRPPSLRNIELTAPYMHDGRFETLDEVLEHYNSGGHYARNLDANIRELHLDEEHKEAIKAFLRTLTDTNFTQNPAFSNPFEE